MIIWPDGREESMSDFGDDLISRIDATRAASVRLNETAERINAKVKEIDEFLMSCQAGIAAETSAFDSWDESGVTISACLAHRRCAGRWRICVVQHRKPAGKYDRMEVIPWEQVRRDQRILAFGKIPELIETIVRKLERTLAMANNLEDLLPQIECALERLNANCPQRGQTE